MEPFLASRVSLSPYKIGVVALKSEVPWGSSAFCRGQNQTRRDPFSRILPLVVCMPSRDSERASIHLAMPTIFWWVWCNSKDLLWGELGHVNSYVFFPRTVWHLDRFSWASKFFQCFTDLFSTWTSIPYKNECIYHHFHTKVVTISFNGNHKLPLGHKFSE